MQLQRIDELGVVVDLVAERAHVDVLRVARQLADRLLAEKVHVGKIRQPLDQRPDLVLVPAGAHEHERPGRVSSREGIQELEVELLLDQPHITDPGMRNRPEIFRLRPGMNIRGVVDAVRHEERVGIQVALLLEQATRADEHLVHLSNQVGLVLAGGLLDLRERVFVVDVIAAHTVGNQLQGGGIRGTPQRQDDPVTAALRQQPLGAPEAFARREAGQGRRAMQVGDPRRPVMDHQAGRPVGGREVVPA